MLSRHRGDEVEGSSWLSEGGVSGWGGNGAPVDRQPQRGPVEVGGASSKKGCRIAAHGTLDGLCNLYTRKLRLGDRSRRTHTQSCPNHTAGRWQSKDSK